MKFHFQILTQGRKNLLNLLKPFELDQLNHIPDGFRNNLVWHLGHVIVSQQVLCYQLSGLACTVPVDLIERFRRGTVPTGEVSLKEVNQLKQLAIDTVERFKDDYRQGIFREFQSYQSLFGVKLQGIEDAVVFNNTHEGLHLGYVMTMRKLLPAN